MDAWLESRFPTSRLNCHPLHHTQDATGGEKNQRWHVPQVSTKQLHKWVLSQLKRCSWPFFVGKIDFSATLLYRIDFHCFPPLGFLSTNCFFSPLRAFVRWLLNSCKYAYALGTPCCHYGNHPGTFSTIQVALLDMSLSFLIWPCKLGLKCCFIRSCIKLPLPCSMCETFRNHCLL